MNNKCVICYSSDENYYDILKISIDSLIETSNPNHNYEIHIIYADAPSIPKLKSKYNSKNITIVLHELNKNQRDDYNTKNLKGWELRVTHATYYRFEIPKIIQSDWCIYLDCDIIIKHDIYNLWNERDDKYSLCAIRDAGNPYKCGKKMYRHPENYFNAGVLLMNLKALRNMNFDQKWKDVEAKHGHCEADQGILNIMFNNDVKILPLKYNMFYLYLDKPLSVQYPASTYSKKMKSEAAHDPYIIHYVGTKGTEIMRKKYGKEKYTLRNGYSKYNLKALFIIVVFIILLVLIYKCVNYYIKINRCFDNYIINTRC